MDDRRSPNEDDAFEISDASSDDLQPFTTEERALFIASLEAAEREIQNGQFVEYDQATYLKELIATFRARKHARGA